MPSQSHTKFGVLIARAKLLRAHAGNLRKKSEAPTKTLLLHAALATQVAAWEIYVKGLATDYFGAATMLHPPGYSAIHHILTIQMQKAAKKLNTPDSDGCRNFLLSFTGFDPWPHWANAKYGQSSLGSVLLVRERLNEILKVRHSFAHGFAMPTFSWNIDRNNSANLSCHALDCIELFFSDICSKTDAAMADHIKSQHGIPSPW